MVYFVGAGPGAVDLITVKGARLLQEADTVIYAGSLVNPQLLHNCKSTCDIYNSASMTLEEVVALLTENTAKTIVRLHTGDPSIYGAIKEQMDLLAENGIEFEVVPGVSSFCGAAASLNAEYTLPAVSQTVILTRMAGKTPVPEKENIRSLATHQATMVLFLTSSLVTQLVDELIAGGYPKATPAAIVYKATWPDEKIFRTTVGDLATCAQENHITKTALIIVGNVLGNDYELSKLYDKNFSHEYRQATNQPKG
ncbi:precorrin-4 C(11)-methyltransferase [Candidatus Epulonipiscium viviparus]|uniref:precorrin-4 C(11)-methyltransferase n=1 Tax=Candidatus Epulonipiscium viviparus TaxID=420336 RepID=UPI00016C0DD3|nr:precorrin-4 C(11)-methyltransferase [Candidatus Epulopiscium viviparus]